MEPGPRSSRLGRDHAGPLLTVWRTGGLSTSRRLSSVWTDGMPSAVHERGRGCRGGGGCSAVRSTSTADGCTSNHLPGEETFSLEKSRLFRRHPGSRALCSSSTSLLKYLAFQGLLSAALCFSSTRCRSSRRCLCSVASSMFPSFRALVTCFHSLLKSQKTPSGLSSSLAPAPPDG